MDNHNKALYRLVFKFKKGRMFVNLINELGLNVLFLSVGLFRTFFSPRKSFKKNKLLRYVMVRFLRKVCLIVNLKSVNLFLVSSPTMFTEMVNFLFEPLPKPFKNPFTSKIINESNYRYKYFYLKYIYILKNTPYNYLKDKKRGRIKRKVLRRLVKVNQKTD